MVNKKNTDLKAIQSFCFIFVIAVIELTSWAGVGGRVWPRAGVRTKLGVTIAVV